MVATPAVRMADAYAPPLGAADDMVETGIEILDDAVAQRGGRDLVAPGRRAAPPQDALPRELTTHGVWLESVAGQGREIEALIERGRPVGVSFRGEPHRVAFCSRIFEIG